MPNYLSAFPHLAEVSRSCEMLPHLARKLALYSPKQQKKMLVAMGIDGAISPGETQFLLEKLYLKEV